MTRVLAYVPDLMDRSRMSSLDDVRFLDSASDLPESLDDAEVVVVDLSRSGALEAVRALPESRARIVGFASHVDRELLARARDAGCDEAVPRSLFFGRLGHFVGP